MEKSNVICDKKTMNHQFALSALSVKEWRDMAMAILLDCNKSLKDIQLKFFVVEARNNVATLRIEYKQNGFDLVMFREIDIFGLQNDDYVGYASDCFRGIMLNHFGKEYHQALDEKFNSPIQVVEF